MYKQSRWWLTTYYSWSILIHDEHLQPARGALGNFPTASDLTLVAKVTRPLGMSNAVNWVMGFWHISGDSSPALLVGMECTRV